MHYQVSRNGQMYGPYTREDLQRYVGSGNVLPTDLAKSDDMPDWIPVSQLLGYTTQAAQPYPPAPAQDTAANPYPPSAYATSATTAYPGPPNLHWALVLLITVITFGLFMPIWNVVVSIWLQKVQPNSKALYLYIAAYVCIIIYGGALIPIIHAVMLNPGTPPVIPPTFSLFGLLGLLSWVLRLLARFMERSAILEHYHGPEQLPLDINPVMVFFFGGLYLQAVLNKINRLKQNPHAY